MKEITLVTGKKFTIDAVKCRQVEESQNILIQAMEEKNQVKADILIRLGVATLCAYALSNAGRQTSTDELLCELTEAEIYDMGTQVRRYNGLNEGEAKAAGSTSPMSTAASSQTVQ